jgi:PAS domain S-box-containing protein
VENLTLTKPKLDDRGGREAKIRRLADSNIVGIIICDVQGRIIEANEAILDVLGYSREELISGQLLWKGRTPAEWAPADDEALAQLSAAESDTPFMKEYFRKDGDRPPILFADALFEWNRSARAAFVIDVPGSERADEALRASEQQLLDAQMELAHVNRVTKTGQLAASIVHEVNQPLSAIVVNAEACLRWLDRGTPDLDVVRRSVEWIINDGNRASEVIRRVRALANQTSVERIPLDINDVVREVIGLVQHELISHEVSLQLQLAPALSMVLGDRVQLQQVIINLVMNGIEAMRAVTDRTRELVIRSCQDEPDQVLTSVVDCGFGISVENESRLFDAFFTTKASGMGMGLSICRSIMEAHGGHLWATANVPHGARFQFTLPVNADTAS